MRPLGALLPLLAGTAAACPGSPVPADTPHDSAELQVTFASDSCAVVAAEMLARVAAEAGWRDPHTRHGAGTRGAYALLGRAAAAADGTPGALSLSRTTADGSYTDLMDLSFESRAGGCVVQACSESQVPSFLDMSTNFCNLHDLYCGLADGCPFALHALDYVEGAPGIASASRGAELAAPTFDKHTCVAALVGDPPATRFLSQRQDHFDRQNLNRWQQRFFVNDTFFDRSNPNAPVFLCVGGEGAPLKPQVVLTGTAHCALMVDYAQEVGALVLAIEHRYYGESIPVDDFSTPSLRFLSSHQALADIASFHGHISSLFSLNAENRWVTFGGSYPGMMAAWARTQYPHLIYASVSSSSPVWAQVHMPEYQDVVAYAYSNEAIGGSQVCLDSIKQAFAEVGSMLGTASGRASLSQLFPICEGAGTDPLSREPAQRDFVSTLSVGFNHQVNDPVCAAEPGQTNLACDYGGICQNFMAPLGATSAPLERLVAMYDHTSSPLNQNHTCIELGPAAEAKALASMLNPSLESVGRIWFYQTCAEFGYYQTCDPGTDCPFVTSPHLDRLEVSLEQCSLAFNMTPGEVEANVAWSNTISGGRNPGVDRVLCKGDVDPWHPLGVTEGADVIMVPDVSHHFWTHAAKDSDQDSVKLARTLIKAQIRSWMVPDGPAQQDPAVVIGGANWDSANAADIGTVGAWFDAWGDHVAAKDFTPAEAMFATDALGFGTWMNYVEGRQALVATQWRNVWPTISSFHHRTEDTLRVTVSSDRLTAVGLVLWTSTGFAEDGVPFDRPGRTTAVFARPSIDADWLCTHTHVSLGKGVPEQSYGVAAAPAPAVDVPPPPAEMLPVLLWPSVSSTVTLFYSDVPTAATFYETELGLTPLPGSDADAGRVEFQLTSTTFLELRSNDGTVGGHTVGEVKATALAFITEDLDAWDAHAEERGWTRSHGLARRAGSAHNGFVAVDPEGYQLEFEEFNPHPENRAFLPVLRRLPPMATGLSGARKSFTATISWLYYQDPAAARSFHRGRLGLPLVAVQPVSDEVAARTGSAHMADIYQTSPSGFFGAVDEKNGMSDWGSAAAVVLSFGIDPIEGTAAGTRATLQALGLLASLRNDEPAGYSGTATHDVEGYSMQWRIDDRVEGAAAAGAHGDTVMEGGMWSGGTLVAGGAVAFVAAWCGWAARGALTKHPQTEASADEMKRMLE